MRRFSTGVLAVVAGAVLWAAPARAQGVDFSGSTQGCFGTNCVGKDADVLKKRDSFIGIPYYTDVLKFEGTSFDVTTVDGRADVNLGSFTMLREGTYNLRSPFTLFLNFTDPTGITPDPVFGGDTSVETGWIALFFRFNRSTLSFQPSQQVFEFAVGGPDELAGQFTLTLNDIKLKDYKQGKASLTGTITDASYYPVDTPPTTVTPEPVSMALLGTGLAGVAAARRRKKQAAE